MICCCSPAEKVTDYHTENTKLKSFIGLAIESGLLLCTGTEAQGHPTMRSLSGLGQWITSVWVIHPADILVMHLDHGQGLGKF